MKNIIYQIKSLLIVLFMLFFNIDATAQQVKSSDQCNILGSQIAISLIASNGSPLTNVKSGLDFNLNLALPGITGCNGSYDVIITTTGNLIQGTTPQNFPYPFVNTGINTYENGTNLTGGLGINIPFKFKPGVTCDGELGNFNVNIILTCEDGSKQKCNLNVSLKAEAMNYWVVEKKHIFGDLSGGVIDWDIIIKNTNNNPGIGDYNIVSGKINDIVNSGEIISVSGGGLTGLTTLPSSVATWNTGPILSTHSQPIVYRVKTYSCDTSGTVVENCVEYNFCLGKVLGLPNKSSSSDDTQNKRIGYSIPAPISCCERFIGDTCATVTLTGTANTSSNFSKMLTYGNNLNYAQGCEGEYRIVVSNNGNIPLNNITISDIFPAGINVTKITVSSSGTNMDYTTSLQTGTFNTSNNQTWSTPPYTNFTLTTTSGTLLGGNIVIWIRFTITAPAGTAINNCATLNYNGTYNGWSNWCGVILPPPTQNQSVQRCVSFTIEEPKAIPGLRKCIIGGQQSYSVGDIIPFRIVVSNHGAANFFETLTDFLGLSQQNLELDLSSVTYSSGVGSFSPYSTTPNCRPHFSNVSSTPPSWLSVNQQTTQNLEWIISGSGMPGNCDLDKAYYLVIEFNAKILPQSFGNYHNTANLGTLHSNAYYNVMRVAQISTTKQVSTEFVEPGQSFNYIIVVKNEGSVDLKDIQVEDQLPSCVTFNSRSASKLDINGNPISSITVIPSGPPPYTFQSGLILEPGESLELTITVTRNANDQNEQCCNPKARGTGTSDDAAAQVISDEDGPVCVKSGLCCDIEDINIDFNTYTYNNKIFPVFNITTGPLPIQEVEISLIDYHVEYNDQNCKPSNMGNLFGHIQPFVGYGYDFNSLPGFTGIQPVLTLQTVVSPVNNSLTWSADQSPLMFSGNNGMIILNFIPPDIINLDCCSGVVYYCFKVRIKDVNCNVCEKIVCGSFKIPKGKHKQWKNEKLKDLFKIQSLKNKQKFDKEFEQIIKQKFPNSENPIEFFKRDK